MASDHLPNRWGIAVAAVLMQICLGAIYGWSVFKIPLMHAGHWMETAVQLNFTLALVFLGVGTVLGGLWQDQVGPRKVATVAGVLYGLGYLIAAYAASVHSLNLLYLGYGVLGGCGMGMGYITPVATLVKWFPERRGLMTGVAVCGYGAGALVMSLIAARLILSHGIAYTFAALGTVYLVVVVIAAQFYANPPQGWRPAGWEPRGAVAKAASTYDFTVGQAMGTWQFWLLWAVFLNVSAGIMIISQASPMAQSKEFVGMTAIAAANIVALISIFNAVGAFFGRGFRIRSAGHECISCSTQFRPRSFSCCPTFMEWARSRLLSRGLGCVTGAGSEPCPPSRRISSGRSRWAEFTGGCCWHGAPAPSQARSWRPISTRPREPFPLHCGSLRL